MNGIEILPRFAEFKKLVKKGSIIPVYTEIIADRDTPVSIFEKLSVNATHAYLLESIEGGERWGRYSFLSSHPSRCILLFNDRIEIMRDNRAVETIKTAHPLDYIKSILKTYRPVDLPGLPRFWGGLVGFISYGMIHSIEDIPRTHPEDEGMPIGILMETDHLVIFDHVSHRVKIVACVDVHRRNGADKTYKRAVCTIEQLVSKVTVSKAADRRPRKLRSFPIASSIDKKGFIAAVKKAKHYIREGDIIQTVLSRRFSAKISVSPFEIYRALRIVNPSPYLFYLKMGDLHLVGSSPEILVRKEGTHAEIRPIAGTRKRGKTPARDRELEQELLSDPKELAEHVMLVDLARNDLGRVCRYHSIQMPEIKVIERYSHVMHIVTSVIGILNPGIDAIDVFKATFPAGTVTGAPKIRAMEIIDELEPFSRGPYAGAVGYFSFNGNMDMAITIRTLVVHGNNISIQAGAGIVADSKPSREYVETQNKAAALITALRFAERGLR